MLKFVQKLADVAASFMNTVILTSVLSAGNHALYAGTRECCSYYNLVPT